MRGYLIDVENGKHGPVEVSDGDHLDQFYKLIGCSCIDICTRKIGEKYYNIVLDDEGLLVEQPTISAVDGGRRPMLAGNLVIFNIDEHTMDLASLDEGDVSNIKNNLLGIIDCDKRKVYPVAVVEY